MRASPPWTRGAAPPYRCPGRVLWRDRPGRMEEMTVPLDVRNDIRSMDAEGVPRAEIARRLRLSRNTVAKYADMEDLSPEPPAPADRPHPAIDPHAAWIDGVLEADLGAPRKQRHTAKRIYDRLVEERRYEGSYSAVQRHVREWRLAAGGSRGRRLPRARVGARHRAGGLRQLRGVSVNLSFADFTNEPHPFAPTHMRRSRQRHAPLPASRSGARSLVR